MINISAVQPLWHGVSEIAPIAYHILNQRVLSFDVGIKHMSLCLVDFSSAYCIRKWKTFPLGGKSIGDVTCSLINALRNEDVGIVDHVLIEQQVERNIQMKVLSHVLQTFYICESKVPPLNIHFIPPKNRFQSTNMKYNETVMNIKKKMELSSHISRKEFKQLSVEVCREVVPAEWKPFFENTVKKDDLSDCFLQFYTWYFTQNPDLVVP